MKLFRKIVWFKVIMTIVAMSFTAAIASDLNVDRSALIQKIEGFLKNEAVTKAFAEKGVDTSKIISNLNSLNDEQLVKMAEQVPSNLSQVGGALEEKAAQNESSAFWRNMSTELIFGLIGLGLLIIIVVAV